MKVRLLTIMAGPSGTAQPGSIIEVDDATGEALLKAHAALAIAAAESAEPETTSAPATPEAATAPPQRRNPKHRPMRGER